MELRTNNFSISNGDNTNFSFLNTSHSHVQPLAVTLFSAVACLFDAAPQSDLVNKAKRLTVILDSTHEAVLVATAMLSTRNHLVEPFLNLYFPVLWRIGR